MNDYNFIRTVIPAEAFKDVETVNGLTFAHFGEKMLDGMDAYECAECSTPSGEFVLADAKAAYEVWKSGMEAAELSGKKREKIAEIDAYDTSDKVNGFTLNGVTVWLDKATRVGLMNSTTIAKNMGQTETTVWFGGVRLTIKCDEAIQLLSALEMYALQCFNVTAAHKKAVMGLATAEEVEKYDVTAGYPSQINIKV